jgi:hypothetical protein
MAGTVRICPDFRYQDYTGTPAILHVVIRVGLLDYGKNPNHDLFWSILKSRLFKRLFLSFKT